jgi:hypothetical protein
MRPGSRANASGKTFSATSRFRLVSVARGGSDHVNGFESRLFPTFRGILIGARPGHGYDQPIQTTGLTTPRNSIDDTLTRPPSGPSRTLGYHLVRDVSTMGAIQASESQIRGGEQPPQLSILRPPRWDAGVVREYLEARPKFEMCPRRGARHSGSERAELNRSM